MRQRSSSRGPGASANRLRAMTASPRTARLPLVLIKLGAICAALVLIAGVVQAQTPSVLTSNTGLTAVAAGGFTGQSNNIALDIGLLSTNNQRSQRFTTGTDTNGYTVTSIGISFETIADTSTAGADLEVTIRPRVASGPKLSNPGDAVCTLNDPGTFTASGVQTFTVPTTCPNLDHNPATTYVGNYYLDIKRVSGTSVIRLNGTLTVDRPNSGAWAIVNHAIWRTNRFGGWSGSDGYQMMIEFSGHRVGGI